MTNTNDNTAQGSLRWAIQQSNATAGSNTIDFHIASSGVQTIAITSALPAITVPVTIDGTSEPIYDGSPLIELDGAGAGKGVDGLDISAGNTTIKGLTIDQFTGEGISLSAAGSDTIQGNFIGTNPAGTAAEGNGLDGVLIQVNSDHNIILDNLISGNAANGIYLNGQLFGATNPVTSGNLIAGNLIGTDVTGKVVLGNSDDGLYVQNAPMTTIGGTTPTTRNIISGNGTGLELYDNSDDSVLEGNYIGTDITGEVGLGNGQSGNGITLRGISNSTIGGTVAGSGNVISGNGNNGISSFVIGSGNLAIEGNLIGTDATGTKPLGNSDSGIYIGGESNVTIGGTVAGAGNVIAANGDDGITTFGYGPGLMIEGNDIGTDVNETLNLGNGGDGINATFGGISVGGLAPLAGNVIANNGYKDAFDHSGVRVTVNDTPVLSNSIYNDKDLGIELDGGNNSQPAPVLSSAVSMNTTSEIVGSLTSAPGTYTLQFFSTPGVNPSGNVEGETLIGTATVTVIGTSASFDLTLPSGFSPGNLISATATDPAGNTSEFSGILVGTGTGNGIGPPSISVNTSAASVPAGQDVSDTFTISNTYSISDAGVAFSDTLPTGVTFVSGTTSTGVIVSFSNGVATASLGTLLPGAAVAVTIVLSPSDSNVPSFTNVGSVSSMQPPVASGTVTAPATTDVVPSADLSVSIQGPSASIPVGLNLTYVVTVTNNGPSAATGVSLTDTLPTDTTLVSATPSAGPSAVLADGILTDDYGDLALGATFTLTIIVTAEPGSDPLAIDSASVISTDDEFDPDTTNNADSVNSVVTLVSDVSIAAVASAKTVDVGQPLTYKVTVTNDGPSPTTDLILTDVLPNTVTFVSGSAGAGPAPTDISGTVTDDIGTLADGASVVIMITVIPDASAPPSIVNTLTVAVGSTDTDPVSNNNSTTVVTPVVADADVAIVSETASAASISQGQDVTFTINVANNGPSAATGVVVNDTLPAGLTFVSGSVTGGGSLTISGGVIAADIGTLADGGTSVVTIVATATAVGTFTNVPDVTSGVVDPIPTNNTGSATVTVTPLSDLSIVLGGVAGSFFSGNLLTYTAVVTNGGPTAATNVVFTDPLFAGAAFQAVEANGVDGTDTNGVATLSLGTIAPGASVTVVLTVIPIQIGLVTDTASVISAEPDPDLGNNSASLSTDVITPYRIIEFAARTFAATETEGYAPIVVERVGDVEGDVTVHFSTIPGGNATPGLDYVPVSYTVDIPSGVSVEVIYVPVLPDPFDNHDELVALQLDSPSGNATVGDFESADNALLDIANLDPVLVGPKVTDLKLSGPFGSINSIEVDTTGNLDPTTASNPLNYTITALGGGGKTGLKAGTVVPVAAADYNALTGSVTLIPAKPLPGNELFAVDVNGTSAGGVSDRAGNLLNSVYNTTAGSDYTLTVARGTALSYRDENGTLITLGLSGPGTLDIDRAVTGQLETLQIVGGTAKKTVISGSVHSASHRTIIGSILGLGRFGSIHVLTTPPFYITSTVYPNSKTMIDAPAVDSLIAAPVKKTGPTVKAKAVVIKVKHPHAETAQSVRNRKAR